MIRIFLTYLMLPALLLAAGIGHCAPASSYARSQGSTVGGWHISSNMGTADIGMFGIARFTFTTRGDAADLPAGDLTVATSIMAIPPLFGVSLSQTIAQHSRLFASTLWPGILSAYAGAGLSMGALALLHQAGETDDYPDAGNSHAGENISAARAHALNTMLQILVPMVLPGLGAAAGYALGRAPKPRNTEATFLLPTLFPSPLQRSPGKYILGIQLVSAHF